MAINIELKLPGKSIVTPLGVILTSLFKSDQTGQKIGFMDATTTDEDTVGIGATGNELFFYSGGSVKSVIIANGRFGINRLVPGARLHVVESGDIKVFFCERDGTGATVAAEFQNAGAGVGLLLDQNGPGIAFQIDSESTTNPLIDLLPLSANVRGDIAFGTSRTADPSSPSEGDLWYDGTLERIKIRTGLSSRALVSRYGPNFSESNGTVTISGGVISIFNGIVSVNAESGTVDTLDTINSSPQAQQGDTIIIRAATGDSITLGNGTGNLKLNGSNVLLNTINDNCVLFWNASNWVELSNVQSAVA